MWWRKWLQRMLRRPKKTEPKEKPQTFSQRLDENLSETKRLLSMDAFDKALKEILKHEGGYVNDPDDRGGETNYGITKKTAEDHGYKGSMKDIPMKKVGEIYKKGYWDTSRLDDVAAFDYDMALEVFDAGVNCGASRAAKWFQLMLNMMNRNGKSWSDIKVDGKVGPVTISKMKKLTDRDKKTAVKALKGQRARHYLDLVQAKRSQEKFLRGWINRVL